MTKKLTPYMLSFLLLSLFFLVLSSGNNYMVGSTSALVPLADCRPETVFMPMAMSDHITYFPGTQELEPNNSYVEANGPLISSINYSGLPNDQRDYFSFYVMTAGQVIINLSNHVGDGVQLQLFYQSINNRVGYAPMLPYQITYNGQPGWYYVFIYTSSGSPSTIAYNLMVTYPVPPTPMPHTPAPTPTCPPATFTPTPTPTFTPTLTPTPPTGDRVFGGSADDYLNSIQETNDGGLIVAGSTNSFGVGGSDAWVVKLNSNWVIEWQKTYGGSGEEIGMTINKTSDGGYVLAGITSSFGAGNNDAWVLKLDSTGSVLWQKTYGGSNHDDLSSMQVTSDGGVVFVGDTTSFSGGGSGDLWVVKLNNTGTVLWQKTYGGGAYDNSQSIRETSDGGFVVTSNSYSFGGNESGWVLKLNNDGSVAWQKVFDAGPTDYVMDAQGTSDGGFVVVGFTGAFSTYDAWALKLNSNGGIVWQKTYGTGSSSSSFHGVWETSDNRIVIAGNFGPQSAWILKLNLDGGVAWQKVYGDAGGSGAYRVRETSNGNLVLAGITTSYGAGAYDGWVLRLNSDGTIPGCIIMGNSNAVIANTSVAGPSTSATVQNSAISPINSSILPQNSTAQTAQACQFNAPHLWSLP